MKRHFLFFTLVIFCAQTRAQQIISPDPNAPVMTFDSTAFDFGDVVQGTRIEKDFHFKNTGKSPLIINEVLGSGATFASYPKEPVLPGTSGIIKVIFPTTGKLGIQDKTSTIESNNRDGMIVMHLKGKVLPPQAKMKFDSTSYHFGKVKEGERVNLELHFANAGKIPLIISDCVTACGCDVAQAPRDPIPPGGSGIIKYTLDTNSRMGMQQKTVTIRYNTDQILVINIFGEIITD